MPAHQVQDHPPHPPRARHLALAAEIGDQVALHVADRGDRPAYPIAPSLRK